MARTKPVPDTVIGRLAIYLRTLAHLLDEGKRTTSSQELAERLGITSAQIRKDLSHFARFGKQGMGYDITFLREQLREILQADRRWEMVLVGAGDLGHAIVHYGGFEGCGFRVTHVFDHNPQKIGRHLGQLEICDAAGMPQTLQETGIKMAIVAVPSYAAQAVVDDLVRGGVKAILNYAPTPVTVPPDVHVQCMDPVIHLQRMTYYL